MSEPYHTRGSRRGGAWLPALRRPPRLLERLLRAVATGEPDPHVLAIAREVEDWRALLAAATKHGVRHVVFERLRHAGASLPEEIAKQALKLEAVQSLENELSLRALRRCLQELAAAAVEVVVLKGPLLAERLYGSALARPCLDIDLLVAASDVDRARAALARVGYRAGDARQREEELSTHHHLLLFHDVYPIVELHFLAYEGFGVRVPAAPLIARATDWESKHIGPFSARVLAPDDEIVHLAIHGAGHRFERLMWMYDIALYRRARPELTTPALLARGDELDVRRAVAASLVHVERTLGARADLPPSVSVDAAMRLALPLFGADLPPGLPTSIGSLLNLASASLLADSPSHALRLVAKKVTADFPRRLQRRRPRPEK